MVRVIVSSNRSKIRHLKECIKSLFPTIVVRSFLEFSEVAILQDNDFHDLSEYAMKKALYGVQKTNLPSLADETLLVVPAIETHKEAFLKKQKSALAHTLLPDAKSLLKSMKEKDGLERTCYLESALALALPGNPPEVHHTIVRQEGSLAEEERGGGTFDFDSLFLKHDYKKTLSEMPESMLVRISHRRKGLEKLIPFYERFMKSKGYAL